MTEARRPKLDILMRNRMTRLDVHNDIDATDRIRKFFRFHPKGYRFMPKYINGMWDGYISLIRWGQVATGLVLELLPQLEKEFKVTVTDRRISPEFHKPNSHIWKQARHYQRTCFDKMVLASKTGGLVLQATGSGKTFTVGLYFSALKGKGLFIVDELTLLEQARRELHRLLDEPVGIIGAGHFEPERITVSTIQTLHSRRKTSEVTKLAPDVVVLDEVHEAINDRTRNVLRILKPKAVFGLTATLQIRKKYVRYPAIALAGPIVYTYPLVKGIKEGYLAKGLVVSVRFPLGIIAPHYYKRLNAETRYDLIVVNNVERNRFVVELAQACVASGKPVIVLVDRLQHLENLRELLMGGKQQFVVLSGEDPHERRLDAIERMKHGKLKLILTDRIFGKGIDIPNLEVVIDASGRQSHNAAQQRFGRGSRSSPGKTGLLHFDISDPGLPATKERLAALRKLRTTICVVSKPMSAQKLLQLAERRLDLE